jgi:nitroimidazol reductase NimA-like FMN-containing flavoprotein (pyridoxamine 5'-phosphate oxidase superfamily)
MDATARDVLEQCRTARLATTSARGMPHVVPVWFVWHADALYIQSSEGSLKTKHARRGTAAAAVVDDGQEEAPVKDGRLELDDLRGVELRGYLTVVDDESGLEEVQRRWAQRYVTSGPRDGRLKDHVWLRLTPESTRSWDYGAT